MKMKIDIYRGKKNQYKFISVPFGTDVTTLDIENLDSELAVVHLFKGEHEIEKGKPLIAMDADDIIKQIEEKGYAIHAVLFTVSGA